MFDKKNSRGIGIYAIVLAVLMMLAVMTFYTGEKKSQYKYSDIIELFKDNKVANYTINLGSGETTITLRDDNSTVITYTVPNVSLFLDQIQSGVDKYNETHPENRVTYEWEPAATLPWWVNMLPTLLLIGAMGALWYFTIKQSKAGGNITSFGRAKPRTSEEGRKVTFDDVAGADEEKAELVELVEFLKNPAKYNSLGARIPKGVLLVGPPGTGKTLLARAVAGEADAPFFSLSGSDFVEMFVGVGASRVRDLFDQAKKNSPSIIFIDEIDAVGRHRGAGLGGGHDEREQTLNQLLVEMDGFGSNSGVIVMAATNRRDILDPALLRPGRFDRQIVVNYPDVKGREEILKVHTRNKPIAPDVDLRVISRTTAGFTGADLENIMNEAALLAARKNRKAITMEDVQEATIKVMVGPEKKSHVVTEKDKRLTAYHESGHAICTYYMPTQDKVRQVSIIPRGGAGGYTLSLPAEDTNYRTKRDMFENIVTLLGGRVSEKLVMDEISTGASSDIQRATAIARAMVTRYGFSEKLGPIVYGTDQSEIFLGRDISQSRNYSENVAAEIDSEIREMVESAYQLAKDTLCAHMDKLHVLAGYLLEHEKIEAEDFEKLMQGDTSAALPKAEEGNPSSSECQSTARSADPDPDAGVVIDDHSVGDKFGGEETKNI